MRKSSFKSCSAAALSVWISAFGIVCTQEALAENMSIEPEAQISQYSVLITLSDPFTVAGAADVTGKEHTDADFSLRANTESWLLHTFEDYGFDEQILPDGSDATLTALPEDETPVTETPEGTELKSTGQSIRRLPSTSQYPDPRYWILTWLSPQQQISLLGSTRFSIRELVTRFLIWRGEAARADLLAALHVSALSEDFEISHRIRNVILVSLNRQYVEMIVPLLSSSDPQTVLYGFTLLNEALQAADPNDGRVRALTGVYVPPDGPGRERIVNLLTNLCVGAAGLDNPGMRSLVRQILSRQGYPSAQLALLLSFTPGVSDLTQVPADLRPIAEGIIRDAIEEVTRGNGDAESRLLEIGSLALSLVVERLIQAERDGNIALVAVLTPYIRWLSPLRDRGGR